MNDRSCAFHRSQPPIATGVFAWIARIGGTAEENVRSLAQERGAASCDRS